MRLALAAVAFLALAASRGGCGHGADGYDPCAGKACGEACTACPPGDPGCSETAVVKACDALGRCAAVGAGAPTCPPSPSCAGKACGASCVWDPPCRSATPPCMLPSLAGHCGADGACLPGGFAGCSPDPACAGEACGDACDPCGGACATPFASACDYAGRCVPSPSSCLDPCAGKGCGDACDPPCPPGAPCPAPLACDRAGVCAPAPATCP